MADWLVQDDQIILHEATTQRRATTLEIARAAADPSSGIHQGTGLHFARIVLSPMILLQGSLPDDVTICVSVQRGDTFIPVPESDIQGVIHNSRWHPLSAPEVKSCFSYLRKYALQHGSVISLGNYLALKAHAAEISLVDNTNQGDVPALPVTPQDFQAMGLGITLFPYQQTGADFLVSMAERDVGVLLADQMGLGKTAQAIALLLNQYVHGPSLLVCPASLLCNWSREFEHIAPDLSIMTHAGPLRTGVASGLTKHDVVITSYETLVNDLTLLSDVRWNVLALDEAQMIRNPETARARSVKLLERRISLALTGTPVENHLLDLWSIAEFVVPTLLGNRENFEEAFPEDFQRAKSLGRIVAPVTLRRLVADVATDLPDLINIETALLLSPPAIRRYDETATAGTGPLAVITALRVLCAHADEQTWDLYESFPPKIEHTVRIITEAFNNNEKVLVFASFQESLDRLFDAMQSMYPEAFLGVIDGRTPVSDRQSVIDLFSAFPNYGALFMNPQAAGVGLNITAANHVIHFNPEWNPALTSQATARSHRRKQTLPVTVHHLFYADTVEEDALLRADWKRDLARHVDIGAVTMKEGAE